MGIFDDEAILESLNPEQEEQAIKQMEEATQEDVQEGDVQEEASLEGSVDTGHADQAPVQEAEHPSTEQEPQLYAGKYKTVGALVKGLTEIKNQLGEPDNLNSLDSPEEMEREYLEAFKRFSSRQQTKPTETHLNDDRYNVLQQQLAQTQSIINQLVPLIVQRAQAPEQHKEPEISDEDQEFIRTMEEIYPGFTNTMERMIMERVKPQLEPIQQLANEYETQVKFVKGWQTVASRNPDFKDYIPEIKVQTQQLAQENPGLFNMLQQQPEALYDYVYQRAKANKAGQLQQQVSADVNTAIEQAKAQQAKIEAQKKAAGMPSTGVKTTPKKKTLEETIADEILSVGKGGGVFDGLF